MVSARALSLESPRLTKLSQAQLEVVAPGHSLG